VTRRTGRAGVVAENKPGVVLMDINFPGMKQRCGGEVAQFVTLAPLTGSVVASRQFQFFPICESPIR